MKMKEIPMEYRPREKAQLFGINLLNNDELLAIIIGSGVKNLSALEIAQLILSNYGCLSSLKETNLRSLKSIKGISNTTALKLMAAMELSNRLEKEKNGSQLNNITPTDIFLRYKLDFKEKTQEEVVVLSVTSRGTIKKSNVLYKGSNSRIAISIREILSEVLSSGERCFYLIHNHPNGIISPSEEDIKLTVKLSIECQKLDLVLLDHIIIADEAYFSFKENSISI